MSQKRYDILSEDQKTLVGLIKILAHSQLTRNRDKTFAVEEADVYLAAAREKIAEIERFFTDGIKPHDNALVASADLMNYALILGLCLAQSDDAAILTHMQTLKDLNLEEGK